MVHGSRQLACSSVDARQGACPDFFFVQDGISFNFKAVAADSVCTKHEHLFERSMWDSQVWAWSRRKCAQVVPVDLQGPGSRIFRVSTIALAARLLSDV